MKISDFYKSDRWQHTYPNPDYRHSLSGLLSGYHAVPEIDPHDVDDESNTRIEVREYFDPYIDERRCCTVSGVFMDEKPVMLFRRGGREGCDCHDRFITDPGLYAEMVEYLRLLSLKNTPIPDGDVYDPDEELPCLDYFYNHKIEIGGGLREISDGKR